MNRQLFDGETQTPVPQGMKDFLPTINKPHTFVTKEFQDQHEERLRNSEQKTKEQGERIKRERLARETIARIPPRFAKASFSAFHFAENPETAKKQEKIIAYLKTGHDAVMCGPNGVGKTYLAYSAIRFLSGQGIYADYTTAYALAMDARNKAFNSRGQQQSYLYDLHDRWASDVLCIDEFDKVTQPYDLATLFEVISWRYDQLYHTILITNAVTDEELNTKIGHSTMSRLGNGGIVLRLPGDDRRQEFDIQKEN